MPPAGEAAPPPPPPRPRVGMGVFVVNEEGCVCLGQRINSLGHGEWALEHGETFEECAVKEETGLDIADVGVAAVENVLFPGGQHKCTQWRWCGWDELRAMPEARFQPLQQLLDRGFRLPPQPVAARAL